MREQVCPYYRLSPRALWGANVSDRETPRRRSGHLAAQQDQLNQLRGSPTMRLAAAWDLRLACAWARLCRRLALQLITATPFLRTIRIAVLVLLALTLTGGLLPDPALHWGKWLWGSALSVRPQP